MNQRMLRNLTRHQAERTEVPLSTAAFTPTAGLVLPARLAGGMTELNPAQRQEARRLLEQLLAAYDDLLVQNDELRLRNNVAGAVMFAVLVSHLVLSNEELSEAQQEGILQGVSAALADTAQFTALGARRAGKSCTRPSSSVRTRPSPCSRTPRATPGAPPPPANLPPRCSSR